ILTDVAVPVWTTNLPPSVTHIWLHNCSLLPETELEKFPSNFLSFDLQNSDWMELAHLSATLQDVGLINNPNLHRIANFRVNPAGISVVNTSISSWIVDNSTYAALNSQPPGKYGTENGYDMFNSTIESDPVECDKLKGTLMPVFTNKTLRSAMRNNNTYSNANFTVCLLPQSVASTPSSTASNSTPFPTMTPSNSGVSTGAAVGIAAGILVVICLAVWVYRSQTKKRQQGQNDSHEKYVGSPDQINGPMWEDVHGTFESTAQNTVGLKQQNQQSGLTGHLDMRDLELCRIQVKDIQYHYIMGSGAFADVWSGSFEGEPVAIKVLQAKNVSMSQLQSFLDEIHLMSTFDSPYIVKFIGAAWKQPKDMKCVMELMDGGDLRDYLAKL
ncbi:hypothetical protein As57867_004390, partial [Aphanomyces stellatus]